MSTLERWCWRAAIFAVVVVTLTALAYADWGSGDEQERVAFHPEWLRVALVAFLACALGVFFAAVFTTSTSPFRRFRCKTRGSRSA